MNIEIAHRINIKIKIPWNFRINNHYANTKRIEVAIIEESDHCYDYEFDVMQIANEQENAIDEICNVICEKPIRGVSIIIHNGSFQLYGSSWKQAMFSDLSRNAIECNLITLLSPSGKCDYLGKHEMVHLILGNTLGFCKNKLFCEGFANAIDGFFQGKRIEDIFEKLKKSKMINTLEALFEDQNKIDDIYFYPQSGVFIKWLIGKFGIKKTKELYKLGLQDAYQKDKIIDVLNITFSNLCNEYEKELIWN
jgi:hypothetical protein